MYTMPYITHRQLLIARDMNSRKFSLNYNKYKRFKYKKVPNVTVNAVKHPAKGQSRRNITNNAYNASVVHTSSAYRKFSRNYKQLNAKKLVKNYLKLAKSRLNMSHNTINANTNRYNNNRLHNNNNSYHNMSNKLALVKRSRFTLKRLAAARRSTTTATNGQAVGPKAPVVEMPVCQYYLEGRCSNDDCPYRHVNVNANARVCQLYLQGHCPLGDKCKSSHRFVGKSNAKNKFITKLIKRAKLGPKTGAKPATQHNGSHRQHRHHHYHRRSLSNSIHVDLQCQAAGADHSLPPYIPISADTTDTSDREAMFATNSNECNELVVNSNQSHRVLTNRRQKYFWLESDDECSGDEDRDVSMRPDSVTARCRPSIRVVPNFML